MNAACALITAGIVFGIVAIMHLLRLFYKTKIVAGRKTIPMWVSVLGFIIALLLAIWMFMVAATIS